ncbi:hypothetical protein nbrc107696_19340 [Gordonia spumicola]|uniref:Lipoprotein n=1 Tax=Gordonia spumicola TaxID=589161 RepID=A0A7I9V7X6_9ACTN|nr:hypothetical protein [Gordonia spumicola]GEE01488.1 hypothetical protein nbrc107696_19340 [Gordonia spumicola]
MAPRRGSTRTRPLLAGGVLVAVAVLTASSAIVVPAQPSDAAASELPSLTVVENNRAAPASVQAARSMFRSSPSAVVVSSAASEDDLEHGIAVAERNRIPVFHIVDDTYTFPVGFALGALDVSSVIGIGADQPDFRLPVTTSETTRPGVPSELAQGRPLVLVADSGDVGAANAEAAGATGVRVPVGDPRSSGAAVAALKADPDRPIVTVGDFGAEKTVADRIAQARTVPELPGGGQIVFPGRRMVALYGSPGGPDLGPLGAQDIPASIRRVKRVARPYGRLVDVPVVPTFEIIVTVASSDPGYRGKYTNIIDPSAIRPWVDAARDAGVYVTLDLQPGRMDFLTQAKMYRDLLLEPHVGLALDPEWRLKPRQVHLTQIGSVDPDEVNRTADWLADLVRTEHLPQKVFVLHQFDADMLGDRSRLDTSHPELATVIHADGHGTASVKRATWQRIITGLPPNVWLGWKNFYKEDRPMFSPLATFDVEPQPMFVSYQ